MAAALKGQRVEHGLYRVEGFNHMFDVFPDGLPPEGQPAGLQHPKVAATFKVVLSFLSKYVPVKVRWHLTVAGIVVL
jgi:hypothetical protein